MITAKKLKEVISSNVEDFSSSHHVLNVLARFHGKRFTKRVINALPHGPWYAEDYGFRVAIRSQNFHTGNTIFICPIESKIVDIHYIQHENPWLVAYPTERNERRRRQVANEKALEELAALLSIVAGLRVKLHNAEWELDNRLSDYPDAFSLRNLIPALE